MFSWTRGPRPKEDQMLRKTMIVLATAAALTGGLTADAFARGGGGGHGGGGFGGGHAGGFGGGHIGGFGGGHIGGFGGGHVGGFSGAHVGGFSGGARVGRSFGGSHLGAARGGFARDVAGRDFSQARPLGPESRFQHRRRFVPGGFWFSCFDHPLNHRPPLSPPASSSGY